MLHVLTRRVVAVPLALTALAVVAVGAGMWLASQTVTAPSVGLVNGLALDVSKSTIFDGAYFTSPTDVLTDELTVTNPVGSGAQMSISAALAGSDLSGAGLAAATTFEVRFKSTAGTCDGTGPATITGTVDPGAGPAVGDVLDEGESRLVCLRLDADDAYDQDGAAFTFDLDLVGTPQ